MSCCGVKRRLETEPTRNVKSRRPTTDPDDEPRFSMNDIRRLMKEQKLYTEDDVAKLCDGVRMEAYAYYTGVPLKPLSDRSADYIS